MFQVSKKIVAINVNDFLTLSPVTHIRGNLLNLNKSSVVAGSSSCLFHNPVINVYGMLCLTMLFVVLL